MKKSIPHILLLPIPLGAFLLLTSCVSEYSTHPNAGAQGTYTTYATLPSGYSGDAYYYNNRYYAGGRYEPGTYSYGGRTYDNRYFYNGNVSGHFKVHHLWSVQSAPPWIADL